MNNKKKTQDSKRKWKASKVSRQRRSTLTQEKKEKETLGRIVQERGKLMTNKIMYQLHKQNNFKANTFK